MELELPSSFWLSLSLPSQLSLPCPTMVNVELRNDRIKKTACCVHPFLQHLTQDTSTVKSILLLLMKSASEFEACSVINRFSLYVYQLLFARELQLVAWIPAHCTTPIFYCARFVCRVRFFFCLTFMVRWPQCVLFDFAQP